MDKLLEKIQHQLDNGHYVEADDIQFLVDVLRILNDKSKLVDKL